MARISGLLLLVLTVACGGGGGPAGEAPPQTGPDPVRPDPLPQAPSTFVHWETPPVHPIDRTPDGRLLLVCNTADHRLEVFDLVDGVPVSAGSVPVGLDPVSVRARSDTEVWVVNHVSDTVSIVDLPTLRVRATLDTLDEPADVVFAGDGDAFVSCSQANALLVFDADDPARPPRTVPIDAEDPRALAVSADGRTVYAAIFESGNGSTALGGGADTGSLGGAIGFPPNVVNDPAGPHGGVNPPANTPGGFDPAPRPGNPAPPRVGLIVKKDAQGRWRDDTGADWSAMVGGPDARRSGRAPGWDLADRDLAIIDAETLDVAWAHRGMNVCMALAVHPGTGRVVVVGTDGTNEVRFEPNLAGRFLRVLAAEFDPATRADPRVTDLNPHLDYTRVRVDPAERDRSIGDPRAVAWTSDGSLAIVAGMGSDNIVLLDRDLARVARIGTGAGPAGIAVSPDDTRAWVLNRFDGTVSVIDLRDRRETARASFPDPTPAVVRRGRRLLYDTHATSGLGHAACGSCHVDARIDRLAWDLGDPAGEVEPMDQNCLTAIVARCEDFHPMKGPMLTQTLRDIVGKEPHHWRGDRDGLEEFAGAFVSLNGDDAPPDAAAMQDFEDYLATISFPPNPFRGPDNSLPRRLSLDGHVSPGRFGPEGEPMPDGDAVEGLRLYRTANLDGGVPGFQCVTCHTLPTGLGPDVELTLSGLGPSPLGPNGEHHHSLVSVDGSTNVSMKIPQLRNLYERVGFDASRPDASRAGFGFLHDGSVDSLARFVAEPVFNVSSRQQIADLVAFLLCFAGSDLPTGSPTNLTELPGPASMDTHASIGRQATFDGRADDDARLSLLAALAEGGAGELVARAPGRGWLYDAPARTWQGDRHGQRLTTAQLRALATPGFEVTFTLVPLGMGRRLGIDRDGDRYGDATEEDWGSDPSDPASVPR